jgi:hypothetical protein
MPAQPVDVDLLWHKTRPRVGSLIGCADGKWAKPRCHLGKSFYDNFGHMGTFVIVLLVDMVVFMFHFVPESMIMGEQVAKC